ncbi:MAG TPA: molybdopterin molybdotransferase MoeA, partial [Chitinophagaceae bacterium]|nr:molybdopterin molybdotransferase MoeA [Chitinophagaceae bacterium]
AFDSVGTDIVIDGEMAAGSGELLRMKRGVAVRIFTGAAVPEGADTVIPQEKIKLDGNRLIITDANLKRGDNVRPVGSEIRKADLAMGKGETLTPAAIGFLAGMGINLVKVFPKPRVSIIVTGNELQHPGQPLEYGQVFESNSYTLISALSQLHIDQVDVNRSNDDPVQLRALLTAALERSELVLMTGGVSVGDYDYTLRTFESCGVSPVFHKIRQKPGKPILFGTKNGKAVFGLPGNPASVLTCFYQYVYPAIGKMMNRALHLQSVRTPLMTPYEKSAGLTHFLKAIYDGLEVRLLTGQESYKLNSFAKANCLVVIPEHINFVNTGDEVEVHILPA